MALKSIDAESGEARHLTMTQVKFSGVHVGGGIYLTANHFPAPNGGGTAIPQRGLSGQATAHATTEYDFTMPRDTSLWSRYLVDDGDASTSDPVEPGFDMAMHVDNRAAAERYDGPAAAMLVMSDPADLLGSEVAIVGYPRNPPTGGANYSVPHETTGTLIASETKAVNGDVGGTWIISGAVILSGMSGGGTWISYATPDGRIQPYLIGTLARSFENDTGAVSANISQQYHRLAAAIEALPEAQQRTADDFARNVLMAGQSLTTRRDDVTGTFFNEDIWGNGHDNDLTGAGGADRLYGLAGNDMLDGGAGNDTLLGEGGNDRLLGGTGDDSLIGGKGIDSLYGQGGRDTIWSSGAGISDGGRNSDYIHAGVGSAETLRGGGGSDWLDITAHVGDYMVNLATGRTHLSGESFTGFENLTSGSGNDHLTGTSGRNSIRGGEGNDRIAGSGGVDRLHGDSGRDLLDGGADADQLYGGIGDDTLQGGSGNDVMVGGEGADILVGGEGEDVFRFILADSSVGRGIDVINGFDGAGNLPQAATEDRIDLSKIDANALAGGNQAFVFLGTSAGGAGCLWLEELDGATVVHANTDGDAQPELTLRILDDAVSASAYWSGDFIL